MPTFDMDTHWQQLVAAYTPDDHDPQEDEHEEPTLPYHLDDIHEYNQWLKKAGKDITWRYAQEVYDDLWCGANRDTVMMACIAKDEWYAYIDRVATYSRDMPENLAMNKAMPNGLARDAVVMYRQLLQLRSCTTITHTEDKISMNFNSSPPGFDWRTSNIDNHTRNLILCDRWDDISDVLKYKYCLIHDMVGSICTYSRDNILS